MATNVAFYGKKGSTSLHDERISSIYISDYRFSTFFSIKRFKEPSRLADDSIVSIRAGDDLPAWKTTGFPWNNKITERAETTKGN